MEQLNSGTIIRIMVEHDYPELLKAANICEMDDIRIIKCANCPYKNMPHCHMFLINRFNNLIKDLMDGLNITNAEIKEKWLIQQSVYFNAHVETLTKELKILVQEPEKED